MGQQVVGNDIDLLGWWLRTYQCQWWQGGAWEGGGGQQVVGNVDKHRYVICGPPQIDW